MSGMSRTGRGRGTGQTGRLITSAALILFFAFAALSAGKPATPGKMFASALGIGVQEITDGEGKPS
jgi:uncharacterized membrane protein YdfJ with MMPL/SSD domain